MQITQVKKTQKRTTLKQKKMIVSGQTFIVQETVAIDLMAVCTEIIGETKCYLLAYQKPDARKYSEINIIAALVDGGIIHNKTIHPLQNTPVLMFSSDKNLPQINKYLHKKFPNLKFVLVRLNRTNFPKMNYCDNH